MSSRLNTAGMRNLSLLLHVQTGTRPSEQSLFLSLALSPAHFSTFSYLSSRIAQTMCNHCTSALPTDARSQANLNSSSSHGTSDAQKHSILCVAVSEVLRLALMGARTTIYYQYRRCFCTTSKVPETQKLVCRAPYERLFSYLLLSGFFCT